MAGLLTRPDGRFDTAKGLLRTEHFQMAYATNDIDRAAELFGTRLGIREWRDLGGPLAAGGTIAVKLAWVGTIMYELITASGPGSDIYVSRLPDAPFALRHHHLGFLIPDEEHWQALMETSKRDGWAMPHISDNPGFMKSCFVDAPELGHYLEYIFPEAPGIAFFNEVPGT